MLLQLSGISDGLDNDAAIAELEAKMFARYTPVSFNGSKSAEVAYNKQFESTCLIITQRTGLAIDKLTVLQFYNALDDITKQLKQESKYGTRRQLY